MRPFYEVDITATSFTTTSVTSFEFLTDTRVHVLLHINSTLPTKVEKTLRIASFCYLICRFVLSFFVLHPAKQIRNGLNEKLKYWLYVPLHNGVSFIIHPIKQNVINLYFIDLNEPKKMLQLMVRTFLVITQYSVWKHIVTIYHTFPDPDFPAQTFMESNNSLNPLAWKK